MFLFDTYNCVFEYHNIFNGLAIIDSQGELQLTKRSYQFDEKEILSYIEVLVHNKRIFELFTKEEIDTISNEINEFTKTNKIELNCNYVPTPYDDYKSTLGIHIYQNQLEGEKVKSNIEVFNQCLQKYCDMGIKIKYHFSYKDNKELFPTYQCYRCKHIIDRSTEYSYLCIKCKNKQYCNKCIKFFDSYKKFGSQLTILKEIEDYNTYINNNIIDDLPCESYHLLMFIPPKENIKKDNSINYHKLPTYLRYTAPNRNNILCDVCQILAPDKEWKYPYPEPEEEDDFELSIDNSLYYYYRIKRKRYQLHHYRRTVGNYSPLFYCIDCGRYFDWECFLQFNSYIQLDTFCLEQYSKYNYLHPKFKEKIVETNSHKDFNINNEYFFGERYWEDKIEKIKKIQKEKQMEIYGTIHDLTHNYIIIQSKFVRIDFSDCITPKLYRNVK